MSDTPGADRAAIETHPIRFPDSDLDDLRRRLASSRLPEPMPGSGWGYGIDIDWLRELLDYWRTGFDWRAVEARLNRHEHGFVAVDGLRVHFLRARSPHAGALPLLLVHGWPGSILEFEKVIPLLVDPVAHGGSASDAFEVVAPSLPGYGLSEAPRAPGHDAKAAGRAMAGLMRALGYARWGGQGGDWGGTVVPYAAIADRERCAGIHLNLVLARRPAEDATELSGDELSALVAAREYMKTGTAYQKVQTLEPDLIGVAMTDSPAALCAWIVSKFRAWSDCGGDVGKRFTRDELLANVTWYWLTRSGASAARLYCESARSARFGPVDEYVDVPTGCALFPRELFLPPRAWAEKRFRVTRWTRMPSGGHFAAMEEPEALVRDVREFFRDLR